MYPDKISEATYRKYLSEFSEKYSRGTKIRSNAYPALDGMELNGQHIFEITIINLTIPNIGNYMRIAQEYDVVFRLIKEQK